MVEDVPNRRAEKSQFIAAHAGQCGRRRCRAVNGDLAHAFAQSGGRSTRGGADHREQALGLPGSTTTGRDQPDCPAGMLGGGDPMERNDSRPRGFVDGNGRFWFCSIPRSHAAVAEAARSVACAGGEPIGGTNNLNANHERPESVAAWRAVSARDAAARWHSITGGNVQPYNETRARRSSDAVVAWSGC